MLHVVVPVYNEHENIGNTLNALRDKVHSPHEVTVVYDFDEDSTIPAVRSWQAAHPGEPIFLLKNDLGRGVVFAIRKGLEAVKEGAALVVMADMSDDLVVVDRMAELMEQGYDVVCGSRYMRGGRQIGGPWLKGMLSRLAGLSLHWLTRIPTHDVSNSFKMYSAALLQSVRVESTGGFEIGLEILVKAFVSGRRITEVPSVWRDRTAGESRFRLWKWMPHYLKWYWVAVRWAWFGVR
ncbi:MAG TPA: glycosyltransferase [Candidatus Xenobia bacterium]|jgi:glycosyltransferase involved in cell wall biosynthesis